MELGEEFPGLMYWHAQALRIARRLKQT